MGCHMTHWLHLCSSGLSVVQTPQAGLLRILQAFVLRVLSRRNPSRRELIVEKTQSTDTILMGMSVSHNAW
jgi:hypothetical protein